MWRMINQMLLGVLEVVNNEDCFSACIQKKIAKVFIPQRETISMNMKEKGSSMSQGVQH